jgi:hypothetical protein
LSISPINSASAAFASAFAFADTVAGLAAGAGAFADAVAGLAAADAGLRTVVINLRVFRLLFEFELLERLEFELLERLELELLERLELELEFEFEFELLRFELRRVFTRAGAFAGDLATTAGLGAGA